MTRFTVAYFIIGYLFFLVGIMEITQMPMVMPYDGVKYKLKLIPAVMIVAAFWPVFLLCGVIVALIYWLNTPEK